MRRPSIRRAAAWLLLSISGCAPTAIPPAESATTPRPSVDIDRDQITQVSVINALMLGQYDGQLPIADLHQYGDFGVGTLDHLDGELIVLDGKAYQVRGDGAVLQVDPARSTPFVVITPFDQDGTFPCPKVDSLSALDAHLATALPQQNNFVAIRIEARVASITMRSVPRQEPPYRPLSEVAKGQSVWTRQKVSGTFIGIRSPSWVDGLNVPGTHWHFLSNDHTIGGHVLDCQIGEGQGQVRYDVCGDWHLKLSESTQFNALDIGRDLRRDLKRVESSRGPADESENAK